MSNNYLGKYYSLFQKTTNFLEKCFFALFLFFNKHESMNHFEIFHGFQNDTETTFGVVKKQS